MSPESIPKSSLERLSDSEIEALKQVLIDSGEISDSDIQAYEELVRTGVQKFENPQPDPEVIINIEGVLAVEQLRKTAEALL